MLENVMDAIARLTNERDHAQAQLEKGLAFKAFVHARFDQMGVPKEFPDGAHTKEGCRVGDRLDWVEARMATDLLMQDLADARVAAVAADEARKGLIADLGIALSEREALKVVVANYAAALNRIASWDEPQGSSMDEPASAEIAREALRLQDMA